MQANVNSSLVDLNIVATIALAVALTTAVAHLRFLLNEHINVGLIEAARACAIANQWTL